ncbi:MAG: hypothetical protein N3F05_00020 [Candidatus Diapherotrites archaeon]|nr:hypothetical protein [Candidatus Diapherotrites archaeon]
MEKLKSTDVSDINELEKERFLSEISSVLKKAKSLQDSSSGIMKEYWSMQCDFAEFLKKKIIVLSSRNALLLNESVSVEISKASSTECSYLKSFSGIANDLKELSSMAEKSNSNVRAFSLRYPVEAKELRVNSLLIDENGFNILKNKARIKAILGEECFLYQKSKAFFEEIDFERVDCNNIADFYKKIEEANTLVSEAENIIVELESLSLETKELYDLQSEMISSINELKQLYSDFNKC